MILKGSYGPTLIKQDSRKQSKEMKKKKDADCNEAPLFFITIVHRLFVITSLNMLDR